MIGSVVVAVLLAVLIVFLYGQISVRLDAISRVLLRVEKAVGTERQPGMVTNDAGAHLERVERDIMARLERIEMAVDPMVRARYDVARLMRELDEALQEDANSGYAHWQVSKIQEQIERGERPRREDWESWIRTPFPWS